MKRILEYQSGRNQFKQIQPLTEFSTAAIYFDFNLPVITNIAKTLITPDKIIVLDNNPGNPTPGNPSGSIEPVIIFPNPANEFLWLSYNGNSEAKASIILHDMNGKRIFAFPEQTFVPGQKLKLTLPNLIKGSYILSVTGDTIKQNRILLVQ